jgi:hypothetical protein
MKPFFDPESSQRAVFLQRIIQKLAFITGRLCVRVPPVEFKRSGGKVGAFENFPSGRGEKGWSPLS